MFGWFERLIDPFPPAPPGEPPKGLLPFLWHYSKPVAPLPVKRTSEPASTDRLPLLITTSQSTMWGEWAADQVTSEVISSQ